VPRVQIDADNLSIEKTVQMKPVSKTVKGGRKRRFSTLMVVGDGNGHVGVGMGKSASVPDAIAKGSQRARKNLIEVPLVHNTIPHMVIGRMGAARVLLKPAAPGTGVIAGPATRAVVEAAGIKDILTKSLGSSNAMNSVYATLEGLKSLQKAPSVAKRRGKELKDLAIPTPLKERVCMSQDNQNPSLSIKLKKSSIGFEKSQKATVAALGLRRVGAVVVLPANDSVRA
jgi:small subunit ribosomal protein S5